MNQASVQLDKRYIFIDTCIIQYMGESNRSRSTSIIKCLTSLKEQDYSLAISQITLYENLHGLWGDKAKKAEDLLETYESKEVSAQNLVFAAWLGGLYHDEKMDGVDIGDKIIASTAILEGGFVLTANHKDYPSPFFLTKESFALPYQVGHFTKTLDLILYKPNFVLIARRIEEKGRL